MRHQAFKIITVVLLVLSAGVGALWIQSYVHPMRWWIGNSEVSSEHGRFFLGLDISADIGIPITTPYWIVFTLLGMLAAAWIYTRWEGLKR